MRGDCPGTYSGSGGISNQYAIGGSATGGDINKDGSNSLFQIIYNTSITPNAFSFNSDAGSSFYGKGFSYLPTNSSGTTGATGQVGAGGGSVYYPTVSGSGLVIGGNGGDGMIVITEYLY